MVTKFVQVLIDEYLQTADVMDASFLQTIMLTTAESFSERRATMSYLHGL
jgi:hypothetical protein